MATHTGAVTVVRFSPCGKYLASGSDDRVVLIWEKDDSRIPRQEFGSEANLESWVARKRLIGHENDVQDLAWAPDSSILVTVGLDSSIIIWNGLTFEKLKTFDAHQSLIKGVTFDPANKYFATASDDRTVRIIRYHHTSSSDISFSIEATISKPFKNSPLSTYYRRCSWSPDGNFIAAANSTNGPVTTVSIINRGTWDSDLSLIGHDAPCEVVSFCPRIFSPQKKTDSSKPPNFLTVLATAGQDKTLAIWNTCNPRPLLVAYNVAEKAITDMTWSPDGTKLFACSLDGTILVSMFEEGELGWVVPMEENENQLTRYGGGKETMQIPNSTEQLLLEEKSESLDDAQNTQIFDNIMGSKSISETTAFTSKTSPKTTPKLLSTNNIGSSVIRKKTPIKPSVQKVTITKEGKKRVAPILLSSVSTAEVAQTDLVTESQRALQQKTFESVEVSEPSLSLPMSGVPTKIVRQKKQNLSDNYEDEYINNKDIRYENASYYIRPRILEFQSGMSSAKLTIPKVKTHYKRTGSIGKDDYILEIHNGANKELDPTRLSVSVNGSLVFSDFLPKYGHIASGDGEYFWAVATEDGTVHVYSPGGRKLISGMVLGSPVAFLEHQGQFLMAVTSSGDIHVWDICNLTAVGEVISIIPLLDSSMSERDNRSPKGPTVTLCGVSSNGKPIITLTNGEGFIYNDQMKNWLRISEPWWAYGSQYWNSISGHRLGLASGSEERVVKTLSVPMHTKVIQLAEEKSTEEILINAGGRGRYLQQMTKSRLLKEGFEDFERTLSTAHLENRISAAFMANSDIEFKQFLGVYVRRLASEALWNRFEELVNTLFAHPQSSNYLCGLNPTELLNHLKLVTKDFASSQTILNSITFSCS